MSKKNKKVNVKVQDENRKKRRSPADLPFDISPEVWHGINIVIIFLIGFIMLLSFFGLAGVFGENIDAGMKFLLGTIRIIFPIFFIWAGIAMLLPEEYRVSPTRYLGLAFSFLGVVGITHLISGVPEYTLAKHGAGAGVFGYIVSYYVVNAAGFWVTLLIVSTLFVVGLLILFNTTPRSVLEYVGIIEWWKRKSEERAIARDEARREKEMNELVRAQKYVQGEELNDENDDSDETFDFKERDIDDESDDSLRTPAPAHSSFSPINKNLPEREEIKRTGIVTRLDINLLDENNGATSQINVAEYTEKIRKTLQHFGIPVTMGPTEVGPTVTRFSFKPAEGIKLSRISALQNDLALALASKSVRIEAPIPGRSLVGIEIPNTVASMVRLRDVIDTPQFRSRTGNLFMALGKDVAGVPMLTNLADMPHLLIAGATNSGKSVCINDIIISLLYENTPDELRLVLVDPKRVELSVYNGIPHLLCPVVNDADKTINALRWTVAEMDNRYKVLAHAGARNISSYNEKRPDKSLPHIIFIIDELADIMQIAAKEVEGSIIRLSQMARAVGIHLILATQRPSVNIITGLIKANVPSRIAFAVASLVDSRTILDRSGAEKLLGKGDMLFMSSSMPNPVRLQGAFISEEEVRRVTDELRSQGGDPQYNDEVTEKKTSAYGNGTSSMGFDEGGDEFLQEAAELCVKTGKASASYLQRRFRIGYSRASRIIDLLEESGVVGPGSGAKPRDVLVSMDQLNSMFNTEDVSEVISEGRGDARGDSPYDEINDEREDAFVSTKEEDEDDNTRKEEER